MLHVGYIGTYTVGTGGKAKGIYRIQFDSDTGLIEDIHLTAEAVNPTYLAKKGKFLFAVNEVAGHGKLKTGAVSAFSIGRDGELGFLNYRSSGATGPCHIAISRDGAWAVVANYTGGLLAALPVGKDGRLEDPVQTFQYKGSGPDKTRQEAAHCHSFTFSPDYRYGFACDLGSDRIMAYKFDTKAAEPLSPAAVPFVKTEGGPRHGIFHPSGACAYFINELSGTVDIYACKGGGLEKTGSVSTLPADYKDTNTTAALRISRDGRFLYASNRGHDSIAVFKIADSGALELKSIIPSGGRHPRDFNIDPTGTFMMVLNKDSDNLVIFRINAKNGLFKKEREYPIMSPCALLF